MKESKKKSYYEGWTIKDYIGLFFEKAAPYILLAPFLFTLIVFFGYAALRTLYYSFTNYDLFNKPSFVGLANYINIFKETKFLIALRNSLTFAIIVTTVQTAGALLLALIMNQKIKGIRFFRAAYYMPSVTSSIVITLIFMWMFQRQGVINFLLTAIQRNLWYILAFILIYSVLHSACHTLFKMIEKSSVKFFDPRIFTVALFLSIVIIYIIGLFKIIPIRDVPPVDIIWINTREMIFGFIPRPLFSIMCLNIWTTIPTMSLLYLAGLQDIPNSLYEAAEVDGANDFQKFIYITLPQLSPITFLIVTLGLIGTLQMFDQVAIIGSSAPLESTITLAYYVYTNVFSSSGIANVGLASAGAFILAIITLIVVFIQKTFQKDTK